MNLYKGFTLIELLIVIAIISLLSSIVYASLSSAREKAQEASVKTELKNMVSEMEIAQADLTNYSTGETVLSDFISSIEEKGATAEYYSHSGLSDDYTRWAVTATMAADPTHNFSVDQTGVYIWDPSGTGDIPPRDFATAESYCSGMGGKLPSLEQLKALQMAHGTTPSGYQAYFYWSGTTAPTSDLVGYRVRMNTGVVDYLLKTDTAYVRCLLPATTQL